MNRRTLRTKASLLLVFVGMVVAPLASRASLAEESPDVVFSARIVESANGLGNDPVRIYEFVRNNVEFANYYGLLKGPDGALISLEGNDYDQAALLVSLLRAAGIPARFVRGKIVLTEEQAIAWLGVDNVSAAYEYLRLGDDSDWSETDADVELIGSTIEKTHVWVEAEIPLAKYRGAGTDTRGMAWVALDPSFKRSDWPDDPGLPLGQPPLDFDAPNDLYSRVHSKRPVELFEDKVRGYLAENPAPTGDPTRSVDDVILLGRIRRAESGIIPTALPYAISSKLPIRRGDSLVDLHEPAPGWPSESSSEGEFEYRWLHTVFVCDESVAGTDCAGGPHIVRGVAYAASRATPGSSPLTLVFKPTSANYEEHRGLADCVGTDGNPVQVLPEIYLDGELHDFAAAPIDLCTNLNMVVAELYISSGTEALGTWHDTTLTAGGTYVLAADGGSGSRELTLEATRGLLEASETYPIDFQPLPNSFKTYKPLGRQLLAEGTHGNVHFTNTGVDPKVVGSQGNPPEILRLWFTGAEDLDTTRDIFRWRVVARFDAANTSQTFNLRHSMWNFSDHGLGPGDDAQFHLNVGVGTFNDFVQYSFLWYYPEPGVKATALVGDGTSGPYINLSAYKTGQNPPFSYSPSDFFQLEGQWGLEIEFVEPDAPYVDEDGDGTKDPGELFLASHFDAQRALTGGLLNVAGSWWFEHARSGQKRAHSLLQERPLLGRGAVVTSAERYVTYAYDLPFAIQPANLLIDGRWTIASVERDTGFVPCCDGAHELTGHELSALEHFVWEETGGHEAISTVKFMQVGVEALGRNVLTIESTADANAATSSCNGISCSAIDVEAYCAIKYEFGTHPWKNDTPGGWDDVCPQIAPATRNVTELRLLNRLLFDQDDYHGYFGTARYYEIDTDLIPDGVPDTATYAINRANGGHQLDYTAETVTEGPGELVEGYGYDEQAFDYQTQTPEAPTAGDPVSVVNGAYFTNEIDLEIAGPGGMNLRLMRSYNSRLDYDGPLGFGWIHTYDQHLRIEDTPDAERVVWVKEDASEVPWNDLEPGLPSVLEPPGWIHDQLTRNTDGTYTLRTKSGMVYEFASELDGRARLESIRDTNGNEIACIYDGNGLLDKVVDAAGRELDFTHDANGHLSKIDDDFWFGGSGGRRWRYTVDADGDLVEYFDPVQSSLEDATPGAGQPWRYTYYSGFPSKALNHNLKCWIKPQGGRPTVVTPSPCGHPDADGRSWMWFEHYPSDRVARHVDALGRETSFSYNFLSKRTDVTYADLTQERYFYDRYGNVTRFVNGAGEVVEYDFDAPRRERIAERDELGFETTVTYDANGNLQTRTDRLGNTESWLYNGYGQPTQHIDRRGHKRVWKYDGARLTAEIAEVDGALRTLREYRYDSFGNRVETRIYNEPGVTAPSVTTFEYDPDGVALVRATDALGKIVRFEPDPLGRTVRVERDRTVALSGTPVLRPIGIDIAYDGLDRAVSMTDPGPVKIEVTLDANGVVLEEREEVPNPDPGASQRIDSRTTASNAFDAMDRLVMTTDAEGHSTALEYDARDRLVRETSPMGRVIEHAYDETGREIERSDASGATLRWEYDAVGREARAVDPLGREILTEYDPEGRPTKVTHVAGGTARVLRETIFDEVGNSLKSIDGEGEETSRVFDELGRPTEVTLPTVLDRNQNSLTAITSLRYDLTGRLVERVDAEGRTNKVRYDRLGRVIETSDGLGRRRTFSYDEVGNLVARIDAAGNEIRYSHDDRGQVLHRFSVNDGSVDDHYTYDGFGRPIVARNDHATIRRRYDALDRLVSVRDPDAGTARFVYDSDGRVTQRVAPDGTLGYPGGVGVHYQYNDRGLLSSIFDPVAGIWRFEYDAAGQLLRTTHPSGLERVVQYTPQGFVAEVTVRNGASILQRHAYSAYDALGNPGSIAFDDGSTTETWTLDFDELSHIRRADYGGGSVEEFDYDRVGNRVFHRNLSGQALVYTVDAADQLSAIDLEGGATQARFVYDAAGRLTQYQNGAGTAVHEAYGYDALGRLTTYLEPAAPYLMQLSYDAEGRRRLRSDTAGAASYFFAGGLECRGATRVRTVALGVDSVIAEIQEATAVSLFADGAENVTAAATGTVLDLQRTYTAFGTERSTTGTPPGDRGFAGMVKEGPTELFYARARHYDPRWGRFLQRDPLGIAADQLYAYAANNPYRFRDPLGLAPSPLVSFIAELLQAVVEFHQNQSQSGTFQGRPIVDVGGLQLVVPSASDVFESFVGATPGELATEVGAVAVGGVPGRIFGGSGAGQVARSVSNAPKVSNSRLQNILNDFYKGVSNPARAGSGTTADAIRVEKLTGRDLFGRSHLQKGRDLARGLENFLRRNPNAPATDQGVARQVLDDLLSALYE